MTERKRKDPDDTEKYLLERADELKTTLNRFGLIAWLQGRFAELRAMAKIKEQS